MKIKFLILFSVSLISCSPKCKLGAEYNYNATRRERILSRDSDWSFDKLSDGPVAMIGGISTPVVCMWVGLTEFSRACEGQGCIGWYVATPYYTVKDTLFGLVNAVAILSRGSLDLITAGYFGFSYAGLPTYNICEMEHWCLTGGFYTTSDAQAPLTEKEQSIKDSLERNKLLRK